MSQVIASRYEIGQKIGSGGMGDVFRSMDSSTGKTVAIKALRQELATPEMITRFMREGEALRQLNHPNIVMMLDAVQENGQHYLVMEYMDGGALSGLLEKSGALPVRRILELGLDLADALTRAHRLNIIHRDIKPANVLLAKDGTPRLTDFGIAHVSDSSITETGAVMGTFAYLAPEVLQGFPADARSDIWALGVMLYEMLAGKRPFESDNPGSLVFEITTAPVPDLEELCPDASPALIDLIGRMLAKNPDERIPRMRLVGAELEAILADAPTATAVKSTGELPAGEPAAMGRFVTSSPAAVKVIKNNLPVQTTPFVGRENELFEIEKLLRDAAVRLVSILAPGGMGKTRLALEAAARFINRTSQTAHGDEFENGVYFVDLAPLTSAENIVSAAAEAVGYAFQQDGRDSGQQLLDTLREKKLLLIMDNFEHVTAGRTLVQDILQAAPGVKILVTSREKLNLSAETVFALGGMEFPAWETPEDALEYGAVRLFMQSARRIQPNFTLQAEDLNHIARICRMVSGMPLGILLAAGWLEALSLPEIAGEISRSIDFLETEMHDLPERQRSIRAVFEYSWALLAEPERALLGQLSIFRGGFTREAAQEITSASLRTLTTLVNKSLLRRDVVSGRFELHELLRQYAEEKLTQSGGKDTVLTTHSRYYTRLVEQQTPRLKGHGQLDALTLVENDFENIRCAWYHAVDRHDEAAINTALEGLYLFLTYRSRMMDGEALFGAARDKWRAEGANPPLLAGQLLVRFPDAPPLSNFRRGLDIARQHNHPAEVAFCLRLVGHWLSHTEFNQAEGIPLLKESLAQYQALNDDYNAATVLDDLGWSYNLSFDSESQVQSVQQSLDLRRKIGDKIGTANSLRNVGGATGGFFNTTGQSIQSWQEAKEIAYEMHDRLGIAWNASLQGGNAIFLGDFEQAAAWLDEAYPHAVDVNDTIVRGFILILKGCLLALAEEKYAEARKLVLEGFPPGTGVDFRAMIGPFGLSLVAAGLKEYSSLDMLYRFMTEDAFAMGLRDVMFPLSFPQIACWFADRGKKEQAAEMLGLFHRIKLPWENRPVLPVRWAEKWQRIHRLKADLEAELGSERYQAALARLNPAHYDDVLKLIEAELYG